MPPQGKGAWPQQGVPQRQMPIRLQPTVVVTPEMMQKRQEEEAKRKRVAASMKVRKVIQRLRIASHEAMDEIRAELELRLAEELENLGDEAVKVQQEAEKAVQEAQEKMEKKQKEMIAQEAKKKQEDQRRKEDSEKAEATLAEATVMIESLEAKVKEAQESVKLLKEGGDMATEQLRELSLKSTASIEAAESDSDKVSAAMKEKRWFMKSSTMGKQLLDDFDKLYYQLAAACESLESLKTSADVHHERVQRLAGWERRAQAKRTRFDKYDSNQDGKLSLEDVEMFAQGEYDYKDEGSDLKTVTEKLSAGEGDSCGVPFEKFDRLCAWVAISKSVSKARKEAAEATRLEELRAEEAKLEEERVQAERELLKEHLKNVAEIKEEAGAGLAEMRDFLKKMTRDRVGKQSSSDLEGALAKIEEAMPGVDEILQRAEARMQEAEEVVKKEAGILDKPLASVLPKSQASLKEALGIMQQVRDTIAARRKDCLDKRSFECEFQRLEVCKGIRLLMEREEKSAEELFADACAGEAGLNREAFASFLRGIPTAVDKEVLPPILHPGKLADEDIGYLFSHVAEGEPLIGGDMFMKLTQMLYRAVKATVITKIIALSSEHICRLEVGEILEVLGAPQVDAASGVTRIRCRRLQDKEKEGYATITGNKGTVFVEALPRLFSCVREAILTEDISPTEDATIRAVSVGEVVSILDFAKKEEAGGLLRARCKCRSDGALGWITIQSTAGVEAFKPCSASGPA